jgi:hypothetical protein
MQFLVPQKAEGILDYVNIKFPKSIQLYGVD